MWQPEVLLPRLVRLRHAGDHALFLHECYLRKQLPALRDQCPLLHLRCYEHHHGQRLLPSRLRAERSVPVHHAVARH